MCVYNTKIVKFWIYNDKCLIPVNGTKEEKKQLKVEDRTCILATMRHQSSPLSHCITRRMWNKLLNFVAKVLNSAIIGMAKELPFLGYCICLCTLHTLQVHQTSQTCFDIPIMVSFMLRGKVLAQALYKLLLR